MKTWYRISRYDTCKLNTVSLYDNDDVNNNDRDYDFGGGDDDVNIDNSND